MAYDPQPGGVLSCSESFLFDHIVTAHGDNTVIVRATSAIEFLTSNSVIGTGSMPLRPAR